MCVCIIYIFFFICMQLINVGMYKDIIIMQRMRKYAIYRIFYNIFFFLFAY